ncbi:MAG TPA: metallophosphoesterase [Methanotrichaceae archaeon]|nr:metallophosphoesterase [Methanotrichaceae archaeon]
MKRIVALSDTHLEEGSLVPKNLVRLAKGADLVLHAGDFVSIEVYETFNDLGHFEAVCGNSDFPEVKALLPERRIVEVEDVKIGLVHRASYSTDLTGAEFLAREMEVDALIFGHTHKPIVESGAHLLICPGSPIAPRLSAPTVAEIEVEGRDVRGRIIALGKPVCNYFKYAESLAKGSAKGKKEG